ncbi:hypothetical protein R2A130_3312 [Ahrensia sp. R2A130]|nr:hypothetical protein R2A130_3312 [Ahrensia sp. R2A130]
MSRIDVSCAAPDSVSGRLERFPKSVKSRIETPSTAAAKAALWVYGMPHETGVSGTGLE